MTPARQLPNPKDEFIITSEEMKWIHEGSQMDVIDVLEDVFKRPHTSSPAPATIIGKQTHEAFESAKFPVFVRGTGWISKIDAERMFAETAAKAEREQVLDAIDEWLNSDDHLPLCKWEVRGKIRSLRAQQGGVSE